MTCGAVFEHGHGQSTRGRTGRDLETDHTASDENDAVSGPQVGAQRSGFAELAKMVDAAKLRSGKAQAPRGGTRREQQLVVSQLSATGGAEHSPRCVDGTHGDAQLECDVHLGERLRGPERWWADEIVFVQKALRECGTLIRDRRLGADHPD